MRRPVSPTGNRAFTLLEVLLAVSVFAAGVLFVFPSFIRSSETLDLLGARADAALLAGDLMTQMEIRSRTERSSGPVSDHGRIDSNGRSFRYRMWMEPVGDSKRIFEMRVRLEREGGKSFAVERKKMVLR